MYVRLTRFEGGEAAAVEAEAEIIQDEIERARRGEPLQHLQPDLARVVSRLELLRNRVDGSVAVLLYCDTIQKVGESDRILASMRPRHNGWGDRVTADIYEVLMDEEPHEALVAVPPADGRIRLAGPDAAAVMAEVQEPGEERRAA